MRPEQEIRFLPKSAPAKSAHKAFSGQTGSLEGIIGINNFAQLVLGCAITAIGIGMKLFDQ